MEEKRWNAAHIMMIIIFILALLYGLILYVESQGFYIYISHTGGEESRFVLLFMILCLFFAYMIRMIYHCTDSMGITFLVSAIPIIIVGIIYFLYVIFSGGGKYFDFYSDDGQHHIVVKEQSMLFYGFGDIYEMTGPGIMQQIGSYNTDDGYRPFTDKTYEFIWKEDGFVLRHCFSFGICDNEEDYIEKDITYIP